MDFFFGRKSAIFNKKSTTEPADSDEVDLVASQAPIHPSELPQPAPKVIKTPTPVRTPTPVQKNNVAPQNHAGASSSQPQPQSQSRLQVLLDISPRKAMDAYISIPYLSEEEEEDTLIASDLNKKRTPGGQPTTAPCGATQPRGVLSTPSEIAGPGSSKRGRPKDLTDLTLPQKPARGRPKGSVNLTPAERLARADQIRIAKNARAVERRAALKARNGVGEGGPQPAKRKGRPPKNAETPAQTFRRLTPRFLPFRCEWKDCPAELQNMATLRRHVAVVHRRAEVCMWGKCAAKEPPVTILAEDDFVAHMERKHLVPCEWHMGDGYSNAAPVDGRDDGGEAVPLYLLDRDGNQVTPSIAHQEVEDFATWRRNRQRLKEYLIQRNENAPFEEESEEEDGDVPMG